MKRILTITAFVVGATGAMAQGLTGATVGLDYTTFPDVDDETSTHFFGAVEFEVAQGFSIAADLANRNFDINDENATNIMLHGIYTISPDVSVGAFIGRETIDDEEIDNYGAEVAYMSGPVSIEAYLGSGDLDTFDLTYIGVLGGYGLGNGISLLGGVERINFDTGSNEGDFTTLEIGGEYAFGGGAAAYAKAGQLSLESGGSSQDENFFQVGVTYSFGPNGGTTFSRKGLLENIPLSAL